MSFKKENVHEWIIRQQNKLWIRIIHYMLSPNHFCCTSFGVLMFSSISFANNCWLATYACSLKAIGVRESYQYLNIWGICPFSFFFTWDEHTHVILQFIECLFKSDAVTVMMLTDYSWVSFHSMLCRRGWRECPLETNEVSLLCISLMFVCIKAFRQVSMNLISLYRKRFVICHT